MTPVGRGWFGVPLALVAAAGIAGPVRADTVQLSFSDGRITLVADRASPSAIFAAWSRAGGVTIVNAERLQGQPLTLRLDAVPEEQALDTLLRSVSGYLATRRTQPAGADASAFERIVILAAPQVARDATPQPPAQPGRPSARTAARPAAPPAPFAPQPEPEPEPEPAGIPVGPGVVRLVGPDGHPVEDDQVGAPPPPSTPYGGSDTPPTQPPQNGPPGASAPSPNRNAPAPPTATPRPGMPTGTVTPGSSTPGMPVPGAATTQR